MVPTASACASARSLYCSMAAPLRPDFLVRMLSTTWSRTNAWSWGENCSLSLLRTLTTPWCEARKTWSASAIAISDSLSWRSAVRDIDTRTFTAVRPAASRVGDTVVHVASKRAIAARMPSLFLLISWNTPTTEPYKSKDPACCAGAAWTPSTPPAAEPRRSPSAR